jgi:hypothetical protein
MKNVGYLISSEEFASKLSKGFFARSLDRVSGALGAARAPWKASSLYDDKLGQTGVAIAVDERAAKGSPAKHDALWGKVALLLEKNGVASLVARGVEAPAGMLGYPAPDGRALRFARGFCALLDSGAYDSNIEAVALVSGDGPSEYLELLADELNYIRFYSKDVSAARSCARYVYDYNGTAAESTSSIARIAGCECAFVLDRGYSAVAGRLRCATVVDPYSSSRDAPAVTAYTDKLGVLEVGCAYYEAHYYNRKGLLPEDDLRLFIQDARSRGAV